MRNHHDAFPAIPDIASPQRRTLLQAGAAVFAGIPPLATAEALANPWKNAQQIIDRCREPLRFRKRDFLITAFGAANAALMPAVSRWRGSERKMMTPVPGSVDCYRAIGRKPSGTHCHEHLR